MNEKRIKGWRVGEKVGCGLSGGKFFMESKVHPNLPKGDKLKNVEGSENCCREKSQVLLLN